LSERKYYVYTYAYPESMGGRVFYVGQGQGDRIDAHEVEARGGIQSKKCDIIRAIWEHGEQVVKTKVREHLNYKQSLLAERDVIMAYGLESLANRRFPASEHPHFLCLPKSIFLSVTLREEMSKYVAECMTKADIELSPENCKHYFTKVCEQAILNHLVEVCSK
jgi:hypothetical protein